MKKIVIARMPVKNQNSMVSVLYEDGKPAECFVRPETEKINEGSIYTGIVTKVDERLDAAFVNIGPVTGYLPLKKTDNLVFCGNKRDGKIKPQDRIVAMVDKAIVKTKHCVLTGTLSINGRYLVAYSEKKECFRFSRKLASADIKKLKKTAGKLNRGYSITFRTLAAEADENEIISEYDELCSSMDRIISRGVSRPCGTCLYYGRTPEADMLKRTRDEELEEIVTDSSEVADYLRDYTFPGEFPFGKKLRVYDDPMLDLYKLYNFSTLLDRIASEKVNLKSGATLMIEQTEAFAVIDVNSARSTRKYKNAKSFLPINLEAADEIALQIRLRQLSGIILIDFINMSSREEEEELIEHFKNLIKKDHVRTSVVDITPLGIMEVTREKRYRNNGEQIHL